MIKICLCCGKELNTEKQVGTWHKECIKNFFGVDNIPEVKVTKSTVEKYVTSMLNEKNTIAGVQKKLSLHLENEDVPRLTLVGYPIGYILKPATKEYENLTELEFCTMKLSEATGILTAPCGMIKGSYITKRMDRLPSGEKLAMEDFCQLSEKLTESKYKGSYESCGKIIKQYSVFPGVDMVEFFLRIVFCFATGNSDMHLKNFSLIETKPKSREYVLSKAYDLLPTNILIPEDDEETALTLNGKRKNLKKRDFETLGVSIGLKEKTIAGMIKKVVSKEDEYHQIITRTPLKKSVKSSFNDLISERINRLK